MSGADGHGDLRTPVEVRKDHARTIVRYAERQSCIGASESEGQPRRELVGRFGDRRDVLNELPAVGAESIGGPEFRCDANGYGFGVRQTVAAEEATR